MSLRKLLYSNLKEEPLGHKVLCHQWQNAKDIWNNSFPEPSQALGIERILKIILVLSQFLFPSIYFRAIFGKRGKLSKHLGVELYVVLKFIISFIILLFQPYNNKIGCGIMIFWSFYMIAETLFYTSNLLFSEDVFAKPHSDKRNLILIIIDYLALNVDFANLYLLLNYVKSNCLIINKPIDGLYFSFITSLTIGYGDLTPVEQGRWLVVIHSFVMLLFGVLFLNFYLSRVSGNKL